MSRFGERRARLPHYRQTCRLPSVLGHCMISSSASIALSGSSTRGDLVVISLSCGGTSRYLLFAAASRALAWRFAALARTSGRGFFQPSELDAFTSAIPEHDSGHLDQLVWIRQRRIFVCWHAARLPASGVSPLPFMQVTRTRRETLAARRRSTCKLTISPA